MTDRSSSRLVSIWKSGSPSGVLSEIFASSILPGKGIAPGSSSLNRRHCSGVPSISIWTPEVEFFTHPPRPSFVANRYTVGRHPMPWRMPVRIIWFRILV